MFMLLVQDTVSTTRAASSMEANSNLKHRLHKTNKLVGKALLLCFYAENAGLIRPDSA